MVHRVGYLHHVLVSGPCLEHQDSSLTVHSVGYGCKFITTTPTASFRTAWALQLVPCFVLIIGLPFLHESPRWLAKVGREKEAIAVLADIQAKGNIDDPLVVAEWEEISTVLAAEREGQRVRIFMSYETLC